MASQRISTWCTSPRSCGRRIGFAARGARATACTWKRFRLASVAYGWVARCHAPLHHRGFRLERVAGRFARAAEPEPLTRAGFAEAAERFLLDETVAVRAPVETFAFCFTRLGVWCDPRERALPEGWAAAFLAFGLHRTAFASSSSFAALLATGMLPAWLPSTTHPGRVCRENSSSFPASGYSRSSSCANWAGFCECV